MSPRPYSERTAPSHDSVVNETINAVPTEILAESPSPPTLSAATTPSPTPQEIIITEPYIETVDIQESSREVAGVPCYPTPEDIIPYDHSLPDFIRQITNQSNLANLQKLSLRVISTLISLHRMASYLPNLRELDLEGSVLNSLRDIGCNFKNLQILKVGRCQLESLDGTFGLTSLRELYAQKNLINDISPCSNLPHIRHIDVSGNRIRNISYAGFLSVCSKLRSIIFTGNPATEVPEYRKNVRRILPQLESLDGINFTDDNGEEVKESEITENLSDSSGEVPDFTPVSPSDSMNNLLVSEEDAFFLEKKNKHDRNVANQDQWESSDCQGQGTSFEIKNDVEDDFKTLNIRSQAGKRGISELTKAAESKSTNIKQKCTSIQKLDKDLVNRSKKSSLMLKANSTEEEKASCTKTDTQLDEFKEKETKVRPATASGTIDKDDLAVKSGAVKKRPLTAAPKLFIVDEERELQERSSHGVSKLGTGLPVCGNLTAALRNRKKFQNIYNEEELCKTNNFFPSRESTEVTSNRNLLVQLNGSGDFGDFQTGIEDEDDLIEEDVMTSSQKWREEFRRFRSNNRGRWEEEDEEEGKDI